MKFTNMKLRKISVLRGGWVAGVVWGVGGIDIWGNLVKFDIFLSLSKSLASQIVFFVKTNE